MSKLISGKEALIALANGEEVEYESSSKLGLWRSVKSTKFDYSEILDSKSSQSDVTFQFRLKPRTITINGIEVPAPFEPKEGEEYFLLYPSNKEGYGINYFSGDEDIMWMQFGAWRTEDEIKQVVSALRYVFNQKN